MDEKFEIDDESQIRSNFDHIYTLLAQQYGTEEEGPAKIFYILAQVMASFLSQMDLPQSTLFQLLAKIAIMVEHMQTDD